MKNTLEVLKALNKRLCSLCNHPAESKVPALSQTKSAVCAAREAGLGAGSFPRLPMAGEFGGIWSQLLAVLRAGCHSTAGPGALPSCGIAASPAPRAPEHQDQPLPSHPSPVRTAFQLQQRPWMMDGVWVLSCETFRSFTVVDSLLSSIGLDSRTTPGC